MQNGTQRLRRVSEYPLQLLQATAKEGFGSVLNASPEQRQQILEEKAKAVSKTGPLSKDEAAWFVQLAFSAKDRELEAAIRKATSTLKVDPTIKKDWNSFIESLPSPVTHEFMRASKTSLMVGLIGTPDYLRIRVPSKQIDESVQRALDVVSAPNSEHVPNVEGQELRLSDLYREFEAAGIASRLKSVSTRLEGSGLDYLGRALLSRPAIYAKLIHDLDPIGKPQALTDPAGFAHSVKLALTGAGGPLQAVYYQIVSSLLGRRNIDLEESIIDLLVVRAQAEGLDLAPGRTERSVLAIYNDFIDRGGLRALVDSYAARQEVRADRLTPAVRERMVEYLKQSSINIDVSNPAHLAAFDNQNYDEYFALAYDRASQTRTDAVTTTPTSGGWDFSVDTFESLEAQAIDSDNILAAGYLYYAYELGERLHVFDMPELLYLQWTYGEQLDLPQGETAALLDKLYTERTLRDTREERQLAYKKVLGLSEVQLLANMSANTQYELLWGKLMEEAAHYIRQRADSSIVEGRDTVSRTPIYRAVRELQYNLTECGNGRIKAQTAKLKALFEQCMKVLTAPEIAEAFGTPVRRDVWTVLDRLNRAAPLNQTVNVSAIRTAAVEGNKVFRFIAQFDENTVTDVDFDEFLRAAEAWIIAKGNDTGKQGLLDDSEHTDEDFENEIDKEFDDEFGDEFDGFGKD